MGRRPKLVGDGRAYQLDEMTEKHRLILELMLQGKKKIDIAKEVGVSPAVISQITNSTLFVRELKRVEFERSRKLDSVREYIETHALELVDGEIGLARQRGDKRVALSATTDLLDRIGMKKPTEIHLRGAIMTAEMSVEELKELLKRRLEDTGVVDARPVD